MPTSGYEWPALSPDDKALVLHQRAALHLLLGAMRGGDKDRIRRAYETVSMFLVRINPNYSVLDVTEVDTLLMFFESMPVNAPRKPHKTDRKR